MNSDPTAAGRLQERPNEKLITLDLPGEGKVRGLIERQTDSIWTVRVTPQKVGLVRGQTSAQLRFVRDYQVNWGQANIAAVDVDTCCIDLEPPQDLESRSIRRFMRVETEVPAAIIVGGGNQRFVYRTQCRIRDLSLGGARLACREALPENVLEIILLTCFDPEDPYNSDAQLAFGSRLVRQISDTGEAPYAFEYGIEFKYIAPQFHDLLGHFLLESI